MSYFEILEAVKPVVDDMRADLVKQLVPNKWHWMGRKVQRRLSSEIFDPRPLSSEYSYAAVEDESAMGIAEEQDWEAHKYMRYLIKETASIVGAITLDKLVDRTPGKNHFCLARVFKDEDGKWSAAADINRHWSEQYADRMMEAIELGVTPELVSVVNSYRQESFHD